MRKIRDCLVKVWKIKEKHEEFSFRAHSDSITSLSIIHNQYLLTGSSDLALKLWDFQNYYTSNMTLNLILKDVHRENWSIKNTFDPYCQDKLIFYNIFENIRADDFSYLSKTSHQVSITKHKFSIFHILCFIGRPEVMEGLLNQTVAIKPDLFNRSPIYYGIIRKHQRCVDLILEYLCSKIEESNKLSCFSSVYALRHDFSLIVLNSSVFLKDFLALMLQTSPVCFAKVTVKLPDLKYMENYLPSLYDFGCADVAGASEEIPVQFSYSLFELPCEVGSSEVIECISSILDCTDNQIFETELIQSYIQFHWNSVKVWTGIYSLLLFLNLILILLLIDESDLVDKNIDSLWILIPFICVNFLLVVWEGVQVFIQSLEYFTDPWNVFDIARIVLTTLWIFCFQESKGLIWLVVVINFLRGLTAFRLFDGTRYYVRLIIRSVNDTKYFAVMLSYSIISFGTMVMVASDSPRSISFDSLWMVPYKLNFGGYEVSEKSPSLLSLVYIIATMINIIVMLNLLVSILGDSHDQFQVEKNIIDYKEKAIFSLEIQQMLFWKRNLNSNRFIHIMKSFASNGMQSSWEGRMIYLEKKIEKISQVFVENQNRIGEKLSEKLNESRNLIEEKIDPIRESVEKILNSPKDSEQVIEILKFSQTDVDAKIAAVSRKMDQGYLEMNEKIRDLNEKVDGIVGGMQKIFDLLAK